MAGILQQAHWKQIGSHERHLSNRIPRQFPIGVSLTSISKYEYERLTRT